jgi:hypothetical protein
MAQPYQAFVGAFVGGLGVAQSGVATFSYANTNNFDAYVPIVLANPNTVNISAGAEVTVYRSTDGGATWETEGNVHQAFSRPTAAAQVQRRDLRLKTGQYLIGVQVGGGSASTWSALFQTAWVISAYA